VTPIQAADSCTHFLPFPRQRFGEEDNPMSGEDLESRVSRLEKALGAFSDELRLAFHYIRPDAASSLTKSRMILEKLVIQVYVAEIGRESKVFG
jgi:hypothetical protein